MFGEPVWMRRQVDADGNHVTQKKLAPLKPLVPMPPQTTNSLSNSPRLKQRHRLIVRLRITSLVDAVTHADPLA